MEAAEGYAFCKAHANDALEELDRNGDVHFRLHRVDGDSASIAYKCSCGIQAVWYMFVARGMETSD